MRMHSSCASTVIDEASEDAVMLNALIAPCIDKY